jgi:hypothetical protein
MLWLHLQLFSAVIVDIVPWCFAVAILLCLIALAIA